METKTFIMDIDGTICQAPAREDGSFDYEKAVPLLPVVQRVNELYDAGHRIVLNTARGMRTYNGDVKKVEKNVRPALEKWLADNGVKYHELVMGKAWGANPIYVDNRNLSVKSFAMENPDFFESIIRVESNI
jgi:capsule biosynthesis phosphatase